MRNEYRERFVVKAVLAANELASKGLGPKVPNYDEYGKLEVEMKVNGVVIPFEELMLEIEKFHNASVRHEAQLEVHTRINTVIWQTLGETIHDAQESLKAKLDEAEVDLERKLTDLIQKVG